VRPGGTACAGAAVRRPGGRSVPGRVDLAWPESRLIVEYEGAYHFDDLQIRRDDRRYDRLIAAGWRVIRLSAPDLRDLDAVVARIARELGLPFLAG
jgi:very-short-patch-repair endonuclease